MKDKDKLNKLLNIIGDLLKVEGNEWLVDGLLKKINDVSPIEEIAKHSIIQNIHEYCVEEKIAKQANDFYKDFKSENLKFQLILDYKKMEHERRRDDFEGFCLSMFQQIEAIVNDCFASNYIKNKLKADRNSSAFTVWNSDSKNWERNSTQKLVPFLLIKKNPKFNANSKEPFYQMQSSELNKYFDSSGLPVTNYIRSKSSWSFLNKLRTVIFYYYFDGKLKNNEIDLIYRPGNDLYAIRNQNHRGGKPSSYQKETIDKVRKSEPQYYFKFYGFLQDFIFQINQNLNGKIEYSSKKKEMKGRSKKPSNTLADNPQLMEAFNKLKKKN